MKRLLLLLLLTCSAVAQLPRYDAVVSPVGTVPANVAICQSGGAGGPPCSPLAVVYSDANGNGQITQPFTTDMNGHYYFYAPAGTYVTDTYGTGYTTTLTTITLTGNSGGGGSGLPAGPTGTANVQQTITAVPGGVAGWAPLGIIPRESVCTSNIDTILATDRGNFVTENDAAACAVTLPQAGSAGFTNNFTFIISNIGAGTVTVTPTTSQINGAGSLTVNSGSVFGICSDNTNYFTCSGGSSFPDLTDSAGTLLTASVPLAWSAGSAKSGNNPQFFRCNAGTSICQAGGGDTADVMLNGTNGVIIGSTTEFGWTTAAGNAIPGTIDTVLCRLAPNLVSIGSTNCSTNALVGGIFANGGFGFSQLSTTVISPVGVPVKADTANANQVVVTTTTDTGGGIAIGVAVQGCGTGAGCRIITTGIVAMTLGTGTCAIGNFVIVDTTTNGRVQCTATYTAGTVIGKAMAAQASVGSTFNVAVGLR